jgi:hypothetical protein
MRLIVRPLVFASMFFLGCSAEVPDRERTDVAAEALTGACVTQAPDLTYGGSQTFVDVAASAAKPPCGSYIVALPQNGWRASVQPMVTPMAIDEASCLSVTVSTDVVGYNAASGQWRGIGSITERGVWTASNWDGGPDKYCASPEAHVRPGPSSLVAQRLFIRAYNADGPLPFEVVIAP